MIWNQLQTDTPAFIWDANKLFRAEWLFLSEAGMTSGAARHVPALEQGELVVDILSRDASASMEIEGEVLEQELVEESVRRRMGLAIDDRAPDRSGSGIARVVVDVLQRSSEPLDIQTIERWHELLSGRDANVLSAPPLSENKRIELANFLRWLNKTAGDGNDSMSPLVRAGLAHVWFESIHPYPFGSGIIGRAIAIGTLMAGAPNRNFLPLATVMLRSRNTYHRLLDEACRDRNATNWLLWFSAAAIEAVRENLAAVQFRVARFKLRESLQDRLTSAQRNALLHLFRRGMTNFRSGLSASGYAAITGTTMKTAKHELAQLFGMGALARTVKGGHVLYHLNVPPPEVKPVKLKDIL